MVGFDTVMSQYLFEYMFCFCVAAVVRKGYASLFRAFDIIIMADVILSSVETDLRKLGVYRRILRIDFIVLL